MKLSGEHVKQIHAALLSGYDPSTLRMMVRMELDLDLSTITGGDNTSLVVFNLIEWAEINGMILPLIDGARTYTPGNQLLAALTREVLGWLEFAPTVPTPTSGSEPSNWQKAGIELVTIPAGEFLYGNDKERVYLDAFQISRTPVTNRQYKVFVDATEYDPPKHWISVPTGYEPPAHWLRGEIPSPKKENLPVVNVSWKDAQAFCSWAGVFLPTEQQWEKAARGTDGREYPWGDQPPTPKLCNYGANAGDTTPVGRYSPQGDSPYGIVDMAGNVWEWCEDRYDMRGSRTLRGGSWYYGDVNVRCAVRDRNHPGIGLHYVGFRVVSPGS